MATRRELGDAAERRAADYLLEQGYTIVTRNAHSRSGEIDIVALDGDLLVFVEVKLRRQSSPDEAITPTKAARMRVAARAYLRVMDESERGFRFDLIAVDTDLRHHQDVLKT